MTKYDCEICCGRRTMRLPIHRRAMAFSVDAEPPEPVEGAREFPCPQCCEVVTVGQVSALREETFAASYIDDPRFIGRVKENLALQIGSQFLKSGYVKFRRGPNDSRKMRFQMVATVAAVHPSKLDTLEQRISERQTEVAQEVAAEAKAQIDNWGSFYGHADILKRDARQMVDDAIKIVMAKRAAWKPAEIKQ